jgi:hypothetical protein
MHHNRHALIMPGPAAPGTRFPGRRAAILGGVPYEEVLAALRGGDLDQMTVLALEAHDLARSSGDRRLERLPIQGRPDRSGETDRSAAPLSPRGDDPGS